MPNKFVTACEIFKNPTWINGDYLGGFNARLYGDSYADACGYPNPSYTIGPRSAGWHKAEEMINDGKIYYLHIFPHDGCDKRSFYYGGHQVCNACGKSGLAKDWWNIKITKDGNAFMVQGEGFINLQESENFAFGGTKEEALNNYKNLMDKNTTK